MIIHRHGDVEGTAKLLDRIYLCKPVSVIEPHHPAVIEEFYKPVDPTEKYCLSS